MSRNLFPLAALLAALLVPAVASGQAIHWPFGCSDVEGCFANPCPGCEPDLVLCVDAVCGLGPPPDELYYDPDRDCLTCCDPTDPLCDPSIPVCDPTLCDPGDLVVWDEVGACFTCCDPLLPGDCFDVSPYVCIDESDCAAGDELTWDPIDDCFRCCTSPPDPPCELTVCDPEECEAGDLLQWDAVAGCWRCVTSVDPHRFLYRDQSDTFTPVFWNVSGDNSVLGQALYLTAGDPVFGPWSEHGATLFLGSENYGTGSYALLWGWEHFTRIGAIEHGVATWLGGKGTNLDIGYDADSTWNIGATSAGDLLTFATTGTNSTGIDLGRILQDDAERQGFRLPQNLIGNFVDITGASEGWLGWATDTDQLMCNTGGAWVPCGGAGFLSYWAALTNGLTQTVVDAVHISDDGLDVAETIANAGYLDAAGDLFVEGDVGVGDTLYANTAIIVGPSTTYSDSAISWSAGDLTLSSAASGVVAVAAGNDLVAADTVGVGAVTLAGSACIANDGADRIFHDTDCDETKDTGEEYIDWGGKTTSLDDVVSTSYLMTQARRHALSVRKGATTLADSEMGAGNHSVLGNAVFNADDADGIWAACSTSPLPGSPCGMYPASYAGEGAWQTSYPNTEWVGITIKLPATITSYRAWVGAFDADPIGSATPSVGLAAFRFDTSVSANWFACTNSGSDGVLNCADTGVTAAASTRFQMGVYFRNLTDIRFYLDDVLVATLSSDMPDSTDVLNHAAVAATLVAASRDLLYGRSAVVHH